MDRAFGGLIQNDAPLVCGGFTTESESKCYLVGLDEVVAELNRPRDSGASVVLQNEVYIHLSISYDITKYLVKIRDTFRSQYFMYFIEGKSPSRHK